MNGKSTGYVRDMLSNISRSSNPLHTGVSRGLRGMLGDFSIRHKNFLDQRTKEHTFI